MTIQSVVIRLIDQGKIQAIKNPVNESEWLIPKAQIKIGNNPSEEFLHKQQRLFGNAKFKLSDPSEVYRSGEEPPKE